MRESPGSASPQIKHLKNIPLAIRHADNLGIGNQRGDPRGLFIPLQPTIRFLLLNGTVRIFAFGRFRCITMEAHHSQRQTALCTHRQAGMEIESATLGSGLVGSDHTQAIARLAGGILLIPTALPLRPRPLV